MSKYDAIKMIELLKVEETKGELILSFEGNRTVRITAKDGKLYSDVSQ